MINVFPCKGCEWRDTSSCVRACSKLHKFLREDLKCHTRVRTTELILPAKTVIAISDYERSAPTRLTWIDLMDSQIDYEDIQNTKGLTHGEKEMLQVFQADNLSYKEITKMYNISLNTFKRIQKKVRKVGRIS